MNNIKNGQIQFSVIFLIILVFTSIMMLLAEPFYPGFDYHFHMRRLNVLADALREGTFPYYIDYTAAKGYGYLSKVFYSDILLIPFALFSINVSSILAYKTTIFVYTVLCGLLTYFSINKICKNQYAAIVTSILYTFSVYRLYDIYQRAALGEAIAMTFVPIVFLGLYYIISGNYKKNWYVIAIGFSLIIFSHAITSLLMFVTTIILLLIYAKRLVKEPKRIIYLVLATIVTVLLTATYIFPILEQVSAIDFYYKLRPIILPHTRKLPLEFIGWNFISGLSYPKNIAFCGVGILLTICILLRLFIKNKNKNPYLRSVDIGILIGLGYILATSVIFPWGRFPFTLLQSIQFPWRLFAFSTFFFAVAGGYYLSLLLKSNKQKYIGLTIVSILTILIVYNHCRNYKYLQSNFINRINDEPIADNFFHLIGAEYMPAKIPNGAFINYRGDEVISIMNDLSTQISNFERNKNKISFDVSLLKADSLELPLTYYIGYKAVVNNKTVETKESNYGLVQIPVNESGKVEVWYEGTTVQRISWYISIISILVLCFYIWIVAEKNKKKNEIS